MERKCKNCKFFQEIGNTNATGAGLCTVSNSYGATNKENKCPLFYSRQIDFKDLYKLQSNLKCRDCDRFGVDYACFTCKEDDSAWGKGNLCAGFIPKQLEEVESILFTWYVQGLNVREILSDSLEKIENKLKDNAAAAVKEK